MGPDTGQAHGPVPPPQALGGLERAGAGQGAALRAALRQKRTRDTRSSGATARARTHDAATAESRLSRQRGPPCASQRRNPHADSRVLEQRGGTSCLGLRLCCAGASRSGRGGALASEGACPLGPDQTPLVPLSDSLSPYPPLLLSHLPAPSCLRALGCLSRDSLSGLLETPPP